MSFYSDLNYLKPSKGPILEDVDAVIQSIYTILGTSPGTRVFRPTWGGCLDRYLFEPCDEITARSMWYDITESLKEEPRAIINQSTSGVTPDPVNRVSYIEINFTVAGFSDTEQSLSLTFRHKNGRAN